MHLLTAYGVAHLLVTLADFLGDVYLFADLCTLRDVGLFAANRDLDVLFLECVVGNRT